MFFLFLQENIISYFDSWWGTYNPTFPVKNQNNEFAKPFHDNLYIVFQRILLQQTSWEVNLYMPHHQMPPFALTTLMTWITVFWSQNVSIRLNGKTLASWLNEFYNGKQWNKVPNGLNHWKGFSFFRYLLADNYCGAWNYFAYISHQLCR